MERKTDLHALGKWSSFSKEETLMSRDLKDERRVCSREKILLGRKFFSSIFLGSSGMV